MITLARRFVDGVLLYLRLVQAQVRSQLQYRLSFIFQMLGQVMSSCIGFFSVLLLFQAFPNLAGWSLGEVALLYGLGTLAFGISDLICGGFDRLSAMILTGTFDRVMSRPAGTFAQVLGSDFHIRRFGRIVQASVALALALSWLDVTWTVGKVLIAVSAVLSGALIFSAIWVIGAAITFWTIETSEVTNVFTYGGEELVSYPMPIYADWLRTFFTFVVPLAFVAYLPALYILERADPLGLPAELQLCSPFAAILFFLLSRGVWSRGVRHYQSTGS